MATISPGDDPEEDLGQPINLFGIMHGDEVIPEDAENRSPAKSKQKKMPSIETTQKAVPKFTLKSALKSNYEEKYHHKFPRVVVEASIALKSENPEQEFVANLQELLKNGQMVDKSLVLCPVKVEGGERKVHDHTKIPTNITLLSGYIKISSLKNRNPFEKQKVYKNGKEVKGDLRNPTIYFSMAIASDEEPEELIARICHEWHRRGGILLKIKELQTFDSETIFCIFNVFTSVPKHNILRELCTILTAAQDMVNASDPEEFLWAGIELPPNSLIPAIELRLMVPKLPGQDTSHYNKLSWRTQANRKAYHVEYERHAASEFKCLFQVAKDLNYVCEMW